MDWRSGIVLAGAIPLTSTSTAQVGSIPPGSTVLSAFLTVFVNSRNGDAVRVHRVSAS